MADDLEDDELDEQPRIARPNPVSAPGLPPVTARGLGSPVSGSPASGGTEELESRGIASHLAPRGVPLPEAPPETGSTEDLEQRGLAGRIAPPRSSGPIAPSPAQAHLAVDQARQAELDKGSGVDQFSQRHHILGPILKTASVIGSIAAPGAAALIPGTDLHHTMLEGQNRRALENDLAQSQTEATTEETKARTDQATATAEKDRADAAKAARPADLTGKTPEETTIHDLMTGENGQPRINPETKQPFTYLEAYQAVKQAGQDTKPAPKQNDFEQFYADWIKDNNFPDTAHNRILARKQFAAAGQAPQHDPRQMVVGPDGKVIEIKPGDVIPQGSKSVTGDLTNKPAPDEQRRADLAENLNENLRVLEDIATRRPDLFGPVAGRVTGVKGLIGSDDPDIGTLETIKHQIGMAQISAHGMRSAQGVDSAATSILNSFKNGPDAVKTSINAARNSVKTFTEDVERAKAGANNGGASGPAAAQTQKFTENGKVYHIPADKVDAFKKDHPNAR